VSFTNLPNDSINYVDVTNKTKKTNNTNKKPKNADKISKQRNLTNKQRNTGQRQHASRYTLLPRKAFHPSPYTTPNFFLTFFN